ncbi:hypothetical protein CAPTEDRAFT_96895, partial [Capitella teleta]
QKYLNELFTWSNTWGMLFNPSKCKILSITRLHTPVNSNYNHDGVILERVGQFKDLGAVFDHNLSFTSHAPQKVKLQLFKSLARPILD